VDDYMNMMGHRPEIPNHGHSVYAEKPWNEALHGFILRVGTPPNPCHYGRVIGIWNDPTDAIYRVVWLPIICRGTTFLPETPKGDG